MLCSCSIPARRYGSRRYSSRHSHLPAQQRTDEQYGRLLPRHLDDVWPVGYRRWRKAEKLIFVQARLHEPRHPGSTAAHAFDRSTTVLATQEEPEANGCIELSHRATEADGQAGVLLLPNPVLAWTLFSTCSWTVAVVLNAQRYLARRPDYPIFHNHEALPTVFWYVQRHPTGIQI